MYKEFGDAMNQENTENEEIEDTSAEDALAAMGISIEDMLKAEDRLAALGTRRYKESDGRICVCGHAVSRHTVINGVVYCKPSRMECPCKKCRPVIEAQDTRKFLRKTSGAGPFHALALGMLSHAKEGKTVKWIDPPKCDRCGTETNNVVPVPVTQRGNAVDYATGFDALLCPKCRVEV